MEADSTCLRKLGVSSCLTDGSDIWQQDQSGVRDLPAEEVVDLHDTMRGYMAIKLPPQASGAVVLGEIAVDGEPCFKLRLESASHARQENYFLSKKSGLLVRKEVVT